MTEASSRIDEIRRQRSLRAANAALTAIVVVQLLFASFAIGHALGPSPMRKLELVAGIALSFLVGVGAALPAVRRRLEYGARLKADLREGRHRRRVLVFSDHLVLDQEVVTFAQLTEAEHEDGRLVLRYEDPIHGGRMLRELEGETRVLDRLSRRLEQVAKQ